ncbi:DNRLRE domain-containing protein [Methanosarcina sp. DH2]|uniref:disaggregatase related repeat-containing protein n=1 Tax=Methanosarcina sp. DH2 TaxID=2605639 RepID=UPI001E37F025|nr:disaggregatase related repeat-containing protein [Methanosarcina sp. DH2]MCC4768772.1 DNRLRE domain-containing protein [Methanosarcina sp. DH2]
MNENQWIHKMGEKKKKGILILILIILISSIAVTLSSASPEMTVYVNTDGSGDFNCDGTDDQVEINKALAYVAENPEFTTVHLKGPKTYVISGSIFIGSDTVLEGDSTAVIKLEDKADWPLEKPLITQIDSSESQNITVKGFEIDGNHDGNKEKGRGKGYYNLIHFLNCKNIQVHDMYMHDNHGDGLKVVKGSNIQFYNNTIYKLGHDALYVIYSSNVEAWNNKITCRTNSGLRIYNGNHVKFYNNVINSEGEGGAGIEIQKAGSSTVMNDIEIYNNLLYETNAAGIWITGYGSVYSKDSAKDVYIHNNKFYKTGINPGADWSGGVVLNGFYDTLIENNIFDGCYGAAIAHKEVDNEFSSTGSGYTTIARNNIIINTQSSSTAGEGYAFYNKLENTHSFILQNNCLLNNAGGNYMYASSESDMQADPALVEQLDKKGSSAENLPCTEALQAGPQELPYEIDEHDTDAGQEEGPESGIERMISKIIRFVKNIFLSFTSGESDNENLKTALPSVVSDNRLKEESPNTTFRETEYMDLGERSEGGKYRDVILFELNQLGGTNNIEKATLSLFWYYPDEARPKDTILEVYRPEKWCEEHVTWEARETGTLWQNPGGDWYDKNGVSQGSTPYATITIKGSTLPDERYYELDVTDLVKEYTSGKYENTGFLIKAKVENRNYIAFYSSEWQDKNQRPKLTIEYTGE